MHLTITYEILNVFNSKPFSGNPAAVVILDGHEKEQVESGELHLKIAAQINTPATAFISRRNDSPDYDIRWFNSNYELGLCGHATLAAARTLLSQRILSPKLTKGTANGSTNGSMGGSTKMQRFRSQSGALLQTKELPNGYLELECPQIFVAPLTKTCREEEIREITRLVAGALCNKQTVVIVDIGRATGGFEDWLQVEVALLQGTQLKDLPINLEAIVSDFGSALNRPLYSLWIFQQKRLGHFGIKKFHITARGNLSPTSLSTSPGDCHFLSRFFAPHLGYDEDQVTATMHNLLAPYWTQKFRTSLGVDPRIELVLKACQASPREGILELVWKEREGTVLIRGDVVVAGRGELFI